MEFLCSLGFFDGEGLDFTLAWKEEGEWEEQPQFFLLDPWDVRERKEFLLSSVLLILENKGNEENLGSIWVYKVGQLWGQLWGFG